MPGRPAVPVALAVVLVALSAPAARAQPDFIAFESGPVRPLALSPDGSRLCAVNTPDGHLEIFDVGRGGLVHRASVPVGLEPVAVAVRPDGTAWVVNHLSDSVSIVDTRAEPPRVVRTLLVGDEPRDIVFAGPGRAFVTTAHRGQRRTDPALAGVPGAGDPQLTTPGIGRADVWVFDADDPGSVAGGRPLRILTLFGDTPRALAVSPDGGTVYVAVFNSGNRTTAISEGVVCDGFDPRTPCTIRGVTYPGGNPGPAANHQGLRAPEVGLIVKFNPASGHWEDELGRNWDNAVRFSLPDRDVFAVDARSLETTATWTDVGTTLFNMAVNPRTGRVYVSNTEARNEVRFEGPGLFAGSTVQGRLAEARITVLAGGVARPRHLNPHIDYGTRPAPPAVREASLATPLDLAVSRDGRTLYVAAFGSATVGVLDVEALEAGRLDPMRDHGRYLRLSGGGPCGLALDEVRGRLYVLTRFDNTVTAVDLATGAEIVRRPLHNPEPPAVVTGRPLLYDARETSSNGEASCASCHIFGDMDHLAWDLGDPDADVTTNPIPIRLENGVGVLRTPINGTGNPRHFHPMKGPMTTQTLRGMANSGAMHWRGDRADGVFGRDPFDADLSFRNFSVAFEGLLGRASAPAPEQMQAFADFILSVVLPPNPVRALDNSLTPSEAAGRAFFLGRAGPDSGGGHRSDGVPFVPELGFTCEGCHTLDPGRGFFGTDGRASFENESQIFKIAHLRNLYQKVGMFGHPDIDFIDPGDNQFTGEQIRGFGFLHDGSIDTLFRFLRATVFRSAFNGLVGFFGGDPQRRDVEAYLLAFDTDLAPVVGQQVTLDRATAATALPRVDLLAARAGTPFVSKILGPGATECDLVAKAVTGGRLAGFVRSAPGLFRPDDGGPPLTDAELRALADAPDGTVTWTCVPFGSGVRAGINRDGDEWPDGVDACPAHPDDARADRDGDGAGDACDNCPDAPNAAQRDRDADGRGDACDTPVGDCGEDGAVTVDELVTGVTIVLGETPVAACVAFDPDGDGTVDVAAVIMAVNAALGLDR